MSRKEYEAARERIESIASVYETLFTGNHASDSVKIAAIQGFAFAEYAAGRKGIALAAMNYISVEAMGCPPGTESDLEEWAAGYSSAIGE